MNACIFLILITLGLVLFLVFRTDDDTVQLQMAAPKNCPPGQIRDQNNKCITATTSDRGGRVIKTNIPSSQRDICTIQNLDFDEKSKKCVPKPGMVICPPGQTRVNSKCTCPGGQAPVNGKCSSVQGPPAQDTFGRPDKNGKCKSGYSARGGVCVADPPTVGPITKAGCDVIKGTWANGGCSSIPKPPENPKGVPVTSVGSFGGPINPPAGGAGDATGGDATGGGGGDVPDAPPSGGRLCPGNQLWDIQKQACVDPKPPTKKPLVVRPIGSEQTNLQILADQYAKQMAQQKADKLAGRDPFAPIVPIPPPPGSSLRR